MNRQTADTNRNAQHFTRIKMVARNPQTRRVDGVHPEDEFDARTAVPMFMGTDQRYYSVPGYTAAMVWAEWLAQQRS